MNLTDLNILTGASLARPAANTGTLSNPIAIDLQPFEGIVKVIQDVGVVSGTNPTWTGKIQQSADGDSGWTDVPSAAFTAVTASNNSQAIGIDTRSVQRYISYVGTIGGSDTPTFNVAVEIVALGRRLGSK